MGNYSVSICMGALNEANSLRKCIETILSDCDKEDIKEILVCICDYTTDECRQVISELQNKYPDISIQPVYQPPEEKYLGGACRTTFPVVTGTHILVMSVDLECGPEYVSEIIRLSKENPGALVKGSRWMRDSVFHGYGHLRKIANKVFQIYMRVLFRWSITDYTYSFEAAPTDVFRTMYFRQNGKAATLEMVADPVSRGIEVVEFPVIWQRREEFAHNKTPLEDFRMLCLYVATSLSIRFMKKKKIKSTD